MNLSNDCREFIALLRSEGVDFLVVGAAALAPAYVMRLRREKSGGGFFR